MDGSADPVSFCIICGYLDTFFPVLVTNPNQVTYLGKNGVPLVNNTNNVVITDNGLILNDPAGSFNDGESIRCRFDNGITNRITFNIFCKQFSY